MILRHVDSSNGPDLISFGLPLSCCMRYLQHLPIVFRRAYLICTECPRSRRDLLWVSSTCLTLGTKSRFGAHAHGEACITAPCRPWSVSNTKATCLLSLGAWCPRLRRGLLQQRRIVLRVSKNTKAKCSHLIPGLVIHT